MRHELLFQHGEPLDGDAPLREEPQPRLGLLLGLIVIALSGFLGGFVAVWLLGLEHVW
jgi:hypothetical protein